MKKIILVAFLAVSAIQLSFGQSANENALMQSVFSTEKKAIIMQNMNLTEEEADAFWPLFDAYEMERQVIGKRRMALLNSYGEKFQNLTDEDALAMSKEMNTIKKNELKLQNKYFKKISKATSPKIALRFSQVDSYIHTAIKLSILDAIPFVGDFHF